MWQASSASCRDDACCRCKAYRARSNPTVRCFEVKLAARDSHQCCGAGGAYSVLQPALSRQLRDLKIEALQATGPHVIASANIGCIVHLQSGTDTPVKHWLEVLDEALSR